MRRGGGFQASKLITNYIEEHCATNTALERLDTLEQECAAMREQLTQERDEATKKGTSQDTVVKGFQNELELAKKKTSF